MIQLVSWNVNGLRACVKKGFLDVMEQLDADIFCIQETKLQEGQIDLELPDYYQYWNYAEKKGYSGTAVFTKIKPLSVKNGIGVDEFDHEGRVITLEFDDYFLVTCYTPNSQSELARLSYRMDWEENFREYLLKLEEDKPVILCGDLNEAGFIDTFRHFYPDVTEAYSWWSYRFRAREKNAGWRIDYFCVSEGLEERLAEAVIHTDIYGSDHCPVGLYLE